MIEDELQKFMVGAPAGVLEVSVPLDFLQRLLRELKHLRSAAGAVTSGESFDGVAARQGRSKPPWGD
jgi:hypothetical protein